MITIEQYDITQFSMRKAWKAEFREFLNNNYNTSFVNANDVFKSIPNVDKFIKKNNLGDKILHIKDIGIVDIIKRTMLEHRKFGMGATVSTNDFKIILLDNYIDFLKSKSNVTTALVNTEEQQIDKEQKTTEGMIKEVKYFRSQRNRAIRDQCAKRDNYTCQVCGFNFEKIYGERGKEFIEVHHKNPMANFDGEHEVKLEDLIALCSNCHSMVHYGGNFLDIDELRKTLKTSQDTYVELHVKIKKKTIWYRKLEIRFKSSSRRWISEGYHITVAYMQNCLLQEQIKAGLDKVLKGRKATKLTFDKLEVFTNKHNTDHIVCLTSSNPETDFVELKECIRNKTKTIGATLQDYRLHVTLAYIDVNTMTLNEVQSILKGIPFSPFSVPINSIDLRIREKKEKNIIQHWDLK